MISYRRLRQNQRISVIRAREKIYNEFINM